MFPTATRIRGTSDGYLYSMVPHQNIANVSLSNSTLTISVQLTGQTITNNSITLSAATVASEIDVESAFFRFFRSRKIFYCLRFQR